MPQSLLGIAPNPLRSLTSRQHNHPYNDNAQSRDHNVRSCFDCIDTPWSTRCHRNQGSSVVSRGAPSIRWYTCTRRSRDHRYCRQYKNTALNSRRHRNQKDTPLRMSVPASQEDRDSHQLSAHSFCHGHKDTYGEI